MQTTRAMQAMKAIQAKKATKAITTTKASYQFLKKVVRTRWRRRR